MPELLLVVFARQLLEQRVGGALDLVVVFGTGALFGGDEGRPLAPKKRPGLKPKLGGAAERLLEGDLEEHPAATLRQRCEFLQRACGVTVSESTVSRALKRMGWSRKKDRWERRSATSS
jgi:transposase